MHRWPEYDAGTLVPPAVVQHDEVNGEHLVWVYESVDRGIQGPISRRSYDEAAILAEVQARLEAEEEAANGEEVLG